MKSLMNTNIYLTGMNYTDKGIEISGIKTGVTCNNRQICSKLTYKEYLSIFVQLISGATIQEQKHLYFYTSY